MKGSFTICTVFENIYFLFLMLNDIGRAFNDNPDNVHVVAHILGVMTTAVVIYNVEILHKMSDFTKYVVSVMIAAKSKICALESDCLLYRTKMAICQKFFF